MSWATEWVKSDRQTDRQTDRYTDRETNLFKGNEASECPAPVRPDHDECFDRTLLHWSFQLYYTHLSMWERKRKITGEGGNRLYWYIC